MRQYSIILRQCLSYELASQNYETVHHNEIGFHYSDIAIHNVETKIKLR